MAASKGLVLMAPPSGNTEAKRTMAALLSAIKPKTKVRLSVGWCLLLVFC